MAHSAQTDMINKKYFILNYPLANSLIILAVLFHVWSGGSEFLGIQGYMSDFITQKFPDSPWAGRASIVIPFMLAVTIEFSFVALLRYLLNSILHKTLSAESIRKGIDVTYGLALQRYEAEKARFSADPNGYGLNEPQKPEKPDEVMVRFANIAMFLMAGIAFLAVFTVSMTVSKKSIEFDTLVNGPAAHTISIDSLDALETERKDQVYAMLDKELSVARSAFVRDSMAIEAEYAGRIGSKTEKLHEYDIREQQTDQSYTRSKSIRRQEIQNLEAEKGRKIQQRSTLLAQAETQIRERYQPQLLAIGADFTGRRQQAMDENENKKNIVNERNAWFSTFLRRYAQFATIGQFICWMYVILAFYVMGIQKKPRVRPESLESGLLSDIALLIYTAPTRYIQNRVRGLLSKVPPLHQIPSVGAVYDIDTLNEIAPLLNQLDQTKSLEEKEKLQNTIRRKVQGYQDKVRESVENQGVESVENKRRKWPWQHRKRGVESDFSTRRKTGDPERRNDGVESVESGPNKGVESEKSESVESAVDGVPTPSTRQGRGVEDDFSTPQKGTARSRRKEDTENTRKGRRKSVENDRANTGDATGSTKGEPGVESTVETKRQVEVPSIFDVDVREEIVLKVTHAGETKKFEKQIRVVIDGINVYGIVGKNEQKEYGWFKKQVQTYEGFYRKGERDPFTTQMRVQLYEAYMDLIERVGQKHETLLIQNKSKID